MPESLGYSYAELVTALPLHMALQIDEIQRIDLEKPDGPTSDWLDDFKDENPNSGLYLAGNKELYDAEIEEILDEDEVVQALLKVRGRFQDLEDFSEAMRARRTVVTRLVLEGIAASRAGLNEPSSGAA